MYDERGSGTVVWTGGGRQFAARDGRWVTLRPARPEDAPALFAALNEVAAEGRYLLTRHWDVTAELEARWVGVAVGSRDLLLVAEVSEGEDSPPVFAGSLSLVPRRHEFVRHTAELGMWLRAAYREIGIGSAMVEAALAWAALHGIQKITLSVRSGNRRALALYKKYGFVEEGRRVAYIRTPQGYEDECLVSRWVGPPPGPLAHAGAAARNAPAEDDDD